MRVCVCVGGSWLVSQDSQGQVVDLRAERTLVSCIKKNGISVLFEVIRLSII